MNIFIADDKFRQGFFSGSYIFLGLFTLVSKFFLPAFVAISEQVACSTYMNWDLWWLIYFAIGWKLQFPSKNIWIFFLAVCLADFFLSAYKLTVLANPEMWNFLKSVIFFNHLFSFLISLLFFFYLFADSGRKAFAAGR